MIGEAGSSARVGPSTLRPPRPLSKKRREASGAGRCMAVRLAGARAALNPSFHIGNRDANGLAAMEDRKRVVEGKSVSVSVDLGGRRIIKKKKKEYEAH